MNQHKTKLEQAHTTIDLFIEDNVAPVSSNVSTWWEDYIKHLDRTGARYLINGVESPQSKKKG